MRYFTIEECICSDTASANRIDNTPGKEQQAHIVESVETLLDPLREGWGQYSMQNGLGSSGIRFSSGYRSPALNRLIGGASTSAHCYGYAFDLVPVNGKMREFKQFCRNFLADKAFDQLISEEESAEGIPAWMHVGYKHPDGHTQRRQFLSMIGNRYYPMTE